MQTWLTHRIKQNERWDNLAYYYYGDALEVNRLIDANPHLPFCEVLPFGELLYVPVLTNSAKVNQSLPPWMYNK